jgi:hypothetical protein
MSATMPPLDFRESTHALGYSLSKGGLRRSPERTVSLMSQPLPYAGRSGKRRGYAEGYSGVKASLS